MIDIVWTLQKKIQFPIQKPDNKNALDVKRMTEQEMLEIALQNSLSNTEEHTLAKGESDHLKNSQSEPEKGKGKEVIGNPNSVDNTEEKNISFRFAFRKNIFNKYSY